ncbi:sensor histidine kinase [Ramlibacter sp.]|uniref:sensor histidine kinase n=1 Tax=Ramlibacter sp. TaxID=1917967 RepID=UPI002B735A15|nr:histidine kinase [Ramlibacter sp.]HWI84452.1 histidine kinase [Ramlibacter sp.]
MSAVHPLGAPWRGRIDWTAKLQNFLQVMAFCLAIATIQSAFQPEQPYAPSVVYSICIGATVWAVIDFGRHLLPSAAETGWPKGLAAIALVMGANVAGFLLGTFIATRIGVLYGWLPAGHAAPGAGHWRTTILITVLAGIVASFYFYAQTRSAYLERKMAEARRHADDARLKLLETQLEPHMLFNTLANLRALIGADPVRAQRMLDHMIGYLRATLDASRAPSHPLQSEFDRLQDYLELMRIRMGPRLQYELLLPRELALHRVPTLLLQPLVENSIKHGLEPKVEGGHVLVSAERDGDQLVLRVHDTGLGQAGTPAGGKGFGLAQVRERLATLYGHAADAEFTAVPGTGATATLRLPLLT